MYPMDLRHLLLIARARMVVAGSLLGLAVVLWGWATFGRGAGANPEGVLGCGVVGTTAQALSDPFRVSELEELYGHPVDLKRGAQLFKGNCASCHVPDRDMSGPALQGFFGRVPKPELEWLNLFMRADDSLFRAGHPYMIELHQRSGGGVWDHRLSGLTEEELRQVLAFAESFKRGP